MACGFAGQTVVENADLMGKGYELLYMEVYDGILRICLNVIMVAELPHPPAPRSHIGLADQRESKASLLQLFQHLAGIGRHGKEKGLRVKGGRYQGDNILLRLVQEPSVLYSRIGGCKKEKRPRPDTKPDPNNINRDIHGAETPIFPMEQPDKKGTVGQASLHKEGEGVSNDLEKIFPVGTSR